MRIIHPDKGGDRSACLAWHDGAMSDDFFSLKMLIISEAAAERELLRQAAAQASTPIEVSELETLGDPVTTREMLARNGYDVVFF